MAAVTLQLGSSAIVDRLTIAISGRDGGIALWSGRVPSVLLVAAGAVWESSGNGQASPLNPCLTLP